MPADTKYLILPFDNNSGISPVDCAANFLARCGLDGIWPELVKVSPDNGVVAEDSVTAHYSVLNDKIEDARTIAHLTPGTAYFKKPFPIVPEPLLLIDVTAMDAGWEESALNYVSVTTSMVMRVSGSTAPVWGGIGFVHWSEGGPPYFYPMSYNGSPSVTNKTSLFLSGNFVNVAAVADNATVEILAANSLKFTPEGGSEVTLQHGAIKYVNKTGAEIAIGEFVVGLSISVWLDDQNNMYLCSRQTELKTSADVRYPVSLPVVSSLNWEEATQYGPFLVSDLEVEASAIV